DDVLFDEQAAASRLGEHGRDAGLRGDREERARTFAGVRGLDRPWRAVCGRHLANGLVALGIAHLAVDHEGDEVLDEVAGVEVDRVVDLLHDLGEEVMCEPLAPGPVRSSREEAIEVVTVLWIGVDAPLVETRTVEQRDDDDRPADGRGIERSPETDRGLDPGVLGRVDSGGDQKRRTGLLAADREKWPPILGETRIVREREAAGGTLTPFGKRDRPQGSVGQLAATFSR